MSLSPDGHQIAQTPASTDPDMEGASGDHLLGLPKSQVVTTAQQAIETIHTGEVQWAAACIERTDTDVSDVRHRNGQSSHGNHGGRLPTGIHGRTLIVALDSFLPGRGGSI